MLAPWGRQSGEGLPAVAERPVPANRAKPRPSDATAPKKAAPKKAAAKPKAVPAPEADVSEQAPEILTAARAGGADDLKRISGVGPKLEGVLNDLGFYHFDQVAAWTPAQVAWVDARLKFKGRIERDDWITQAAALA